MFTNNSVSITAGRMLFDRPLLALLSRCIKEGVTMVAKTRAVVECRCEVIQRWQQYHYFFASFLMKLTSAVKWHVQEFLVINHNLPGVNCFCMREFVEKHVLFLSNWLVLLSNFFHARNYSDAIQSQLSISVCGLFIDDVWILNRNWST
jgi:hypothetical protein